MLCSSFTILRGKNNVQLIYKALVDDLLTDNKHVIKGALS